MEYKSLKGYTGWGQLGMLLLFLGVGLILAAIVQGIILFRLVPAGTGINEMSAALYDVIRKPENMGALQLSQVLGTLCLFCVPAVFYSWITNGKNPFWLGFSKYVTPLQIGVGFAIIFLANIVAGPLADMSKNLVAHFPSFDVLARQMENTYNEQLLAMSHLETWPQFIIAVFIIAFFPAVFEELFFRGALQNILIKWWKKPLVAIIVTSLIFSLIHMSIYLFLSRFLLGLILGLLYYKSKNIWVNIVAHFLNNALAVANLFYLSGKGKALNVADIDPAVPSWLGLLALAAVIGLFLLFDNMSRPQLQRIEAKENLLRQNIDDPFFGIAQHENKLDGF